MTGDRDHLHSPASRRAALRSAGLALAAGAPLALAACGDDDRAAPAARGPADADVLNTLLDIEYTTVAAYRYAAGRIGPPARLTAGAFEAQEQEHARALARAIRDLGVKPNRPRTVYTRPPLPNDTTVLLFLRDLENTAIGAYMDAIPKITNSALRGMVASIGTVEAQHVTVLRGIVQEPQVPAVFERGAQ